MALENDIMNICSLPLRLYSDVLPSDKKRKVVPAEEFYADHFPNELPKEEPKL